jgi:hypothetical protein
MEFVRQLFARQGSPPRSGRGGRRFKSCHSDQLSSQQKSSRGTIWGMKRLVLRTRLPPTVAPATWSQDTAGKRSDFFRAEFLYASLTLRPGFISSPTPDGLKVVIRNGRSLRECKLHLAETKLSDA